MEEKPYIWENLKTFEKQPFIDRAHSILTAREKFIPDMYVRNEQGKVIGLNPRVETLAIELFEQNTCDDYDTRYYYPPSAAELVGRYDVEVTDTGVIIPTADRQEAKRVKKALLMLLNAPSSIGTGLRTGMELKRITELLKDVDRKP